MNLLSIALAQPKNKSTLDKFSDNGTNALFNGIPIGGGSGSSSEPTYTTKDSWSTTGSKTFSTPMTKLFIDNTGSADLTFTVNSMTITVKPKEKYENIFDPFTQITIATTSTFTANVESLKSGTPLYSAKESFSGSTTTTKTLSGAMYGLDISNDGASPLTYTINGITLSLPAGKVAEKYFDAFTQVIITTTVPYRAIARGSYSPSGVIDTTTPNPVTNLVAGVATINSIPLTWTNSISSDVASLEVAYSTDGANFTIAAGALVASTTAYTVTGLTQSTSYTIRVIAIDGANNRSVATTVTKMTITPDTTAPDPVSALIAGTATTTTIPLTWTASASSDKSVHEIAYSTDGSNFTVASAVVAAGATSYTITGLTSGTTYTVRVVVIDTSNNRSTPVTITKTTDALDTTAPNPVTGLTAGTPTSSTIPVSWTLSSSGDVANYEVAYSTDETNYTIASSLLGSSLTSYEVVGLIAELTYMIRVVAIDGAGNRSTAVMVQAMTAVAPAAASTEIYDSFNRADSSTTMGITTTQNKTWTPYSGTWGIEGNKAKKFSAAKAFTVIDSGISDGVIEVQFSQVALGQKIIFHSKDSLNQFEFDVDNINQYRLVRSLAGTGFTHPFSAKVFAQASDVIRIVLNGSDIKININGVERFSGTDSNHVTETKHGLSGETDNAAKWEYFTVKPSTDTSPLISVVPHGREFGVPIDVTLSADKPSTIHYTLDGLEPTTASAVYSTPIAIDASKVLKYIGVNTATGVSSVVKSVDYTITPITPLTTGIVTDNLYLWYDFIDGADSVGRQILDRTGKGNHGALRKGSTPTAWVSSGLNLKTTGLTTNRPFNGNGDSYSLELHVEFKEAPANNKTLLAHRGTDSNDGFVFVHADGNPNLSFRRLKNGSNSVNQVLLANYLLDTKYHLVVTVEKLTANSTKYTGYVNGAQTFTVTDPNNAVLREVDTLTYGFVPMLTHEIQSTILYSTRMYTKALTSSEVTKNYTYEQTIARV